MATTTKHHEQTKDTEAAGAAVWVDEDYDRERASDGRSRLGAYLRQGLVLADVEDLEGPARFAAWAWRRATVPVMSPGFVCFAGRILDLVLVVDPDDGALVGQAEVALHLPHVPMRWASWERSYGGEWREPGRRPRALGRALLVTDELAGPWPAPPADLDDLVELLAVAKASIAHAVRVLNGALVPVLAALAASG